MSKLWGYCRGMHFIYSTSLACAVGCITIIVQQLGILLLLFKCSLFAHFDVDGVLFSKHPLLHSNLSRLSKGCMVALIFIRTIIYRIHLKIYHLSRSSVCPRVVFVKLWVFDLRVLMCHTKVQRFLAYISTNIL